MLWVTVFDRAAVGRKASETATITRVKDVRTIFHTGSLRPTRIE
jgi:hypothetical protein